MRGLIVDLETSGGNAEVDKIIEIGFVLYNFEHQDIEACGSRLIKAHDNPVYFVNKIPVALLRATRHSNVLKYMFEIFKTYDFDYVVAHNADFEKRFFDANGVKFSKPWVCTYRDFQWPSGNKNLVATAVDLEVPVVRVHRAINDCMLLADCFNRLDKNDLMQRLEDALDPKYLYKANISKEHRQLAKDAGFRWNSSAIRWEKKITEKRASSFTFPVQRVD